MPFVLLLAGPAAPSTDSGQLLGPDPPPSGHLFGAFQLLQPLHGGMLHHGFVGVLALALIGGAVYFLRSPEALPAAPALTNACNGDASLCARRLDEVVFAGAHNAMSPAELPGWMFPNQELAPVSLLGHGVRALLFDVHYGARVGDRVKTESEDEAASRAKFEKVLGKEAVDAAMRIRARLQGPATGPRAAYLCHGFCELGATPLVAMLEGVHEFLVAHPGEVLVNVDLSRLSPLLRIGYRGGDHLTLETEGGIEKTTTTSATHTDDTKRRFWMLGYRWDFQDDPSRLCRHSGASRNPVATGNPPGCRHDRQG